jgi:peptidyl-prolyl cis-trans isomerase C
MVMLSPRQYVSSSLLLYFCLLLSASALSVSTTAEQEREQAKVWYVKDTPLPFGKTLPLSPVTLFAIFLGLFNLYRIFSATSWCEASHILLEEHDDKTKEALEAMKKDIGNDPIKFAEFAKKYSKCPSKSTGGNLGRFKIGTMAKEFNKACFKPDSPVKTTLGPFETQFGWHLVFIHRRSLNDTILVWD